MDEHGTSGNEATPGGTPAPGWYPDPAGSPAQRFWDGAAWTDALQPPAAPHEPSPGTPSPGADSKPPVRKKYLWGGVITAAVVVVGIVLAVALSGGDGKGKNGGGDQADGGRQTTAGLDTPITKLKVTYPAGASYGYTPTITGVPQTHKFEFDFNFDFRKRVDQLTKERAARLKQPVPSEPDRFTAIGVYSDPALTIDADVLVDQYDSSHKMFIEPAEFATVRHGASGPKVRVRSGGDLAWGLHHDYYIVRYVSPDTGALLAKPVVTHFVVQGLMQAPAVNTTTDADGFLTLRWNKVPGATKYFLVTATQRSDQRGITDVDLVATTTRTSFTEPDKPPYASAKEGEQQNYDFSDITESQDFKKDDPGTPSLESGHQFGVIATDGTRFSGFVSHDTNAEIGSLPAGLATNAQSKAFPSGAFADTWDQLPRSFPYSAVNGVTLSGVPQIDLQTIERDTSCKDCYSFTLYGRGTYLFLGFGVTRPGGLPALKKAAAAYNASFSDTSAKAGVPAFNYAQAAAAGSSYDLEHPSTTQPTVPYPVYGSGPLVKFLAANMIAHKSVVNAAKFLDAPGAPSLTTAASEAELQNPYVIGLDGVASLGGGTIQFHYVYPATKTGTLQKQLQQKVTAVAATAKRAGSPTAQTRAINDYLVAHARYDYPAYNSLQETKTVLAKYQPTQDATGILLDGSGVCTSYAKAFNAVARTAGLDSVVVTGKITNDGVGHAWNKVKIGGRWKAVDVTWDDSPRGNAYLLIQDSGFTGAAKRSLDSAWIDPAFAKSYATS